MTDALGSTPDPEIRSASLRIGCIGAGMIMAECHLAAYRQAGFPVAAIASRTKARAPRPSPAAGASPPCTRRPRR